jgi:hypothetical protein
MLNVTLPRPPDREALVGFWTSVAVSSGAVTAAAVVAVGILDAPASALVGVGVGVAVMAAGYRRERTVERAYSRWNRLAFRYARGARTAITAIWYWTVLSVIARTGEQEKLSMVRSRWVPRETQPASAYGGLDALPVDKDASGGFRELAGWAVRSRRYWALVLLPLIALLKALDTRGPKKASSDMYTLY